MPRFTDRLKHAWSAFFGRDAPRNLGPQYSMRPDVHRLRRGNAKSIVAPIYNKIAVDCASVPIKHVRLDENGKFEEEIKTSFLSYCLTTEANIDQTSRAFFQDAVMSMLDEGVVALVPVKTDDSPIDGRAFDVMELRTGKVVAWYPEDVRVECYNDRTGRKEEITIPKRMTALVENPFAAVMNEPNSTMQRLERKLAILDYVDELTGSGRLDLIIQVPYSSRREMDKQRADYRRQDIEEQLTKSKYGIAWLDGTENVVQLNRPLENNLLEQIQDLRNELYNQLGMTEEIFNGTADEQQRLNYNNCTLEPIMSAIVDEMKRKFLSKTARTRGQSIMFFREPFKLVPMEELAKIADVFTRNEIMTSNEFRAVIGFKPVDTDRANELINKNMPVQDITGEEPGVQELPQSTDGPRIDLNTPISALTEGAPYEV